MSYNISEFLTVLKNDLGLRDLPLPVDDNALIEQIRLSALYEFSQRYPRIINCQIDESNRVTDFTHANDYTYNTIPKTDLYGDNRQKYLIPEQYYQGADIMGVTQVQQGRPNGYADFYYPNTMYDPMSLIGANIDIKLAASMSQSIAKSMTFRFEKPNVLYIMDGWSGGIYTVTLRVSHDISLATIPDTAMTHFRKLARYDLEAYLYGLLKRRNRIETGVGTIELQIDDWQDSRNKFDELLKEWDDEGANLDIDRIFYF